MIRLDEPTMLRGSSQSHFIQQAAHTHTSLARNVMASQPHCQVAAHALMRSAKLNSKSLFVGGRDVSFQKKVRALTNSVMHSSKSF